MNREFKNEIEANEFMVENYNKFLENNQKNIFKKGTLGDALFCYTGSMSYIYNNFLFKNIDKKVLIKDDTIDDDDLNNIKLILDSFNKNIINEDIVLYHYMNITKEFIDDSLKKNNNHYIPKRFLSTTLLKKCQGIKKLSANKKYNFLLKIYVSKGTKCIPIMWGNDQSKLKEYEIILEPFLKLKFLKKKRIFFSKIKYVYEFII